MKCLNCGCDLPSSAKFCPKCGNKVILEETINVNMMERQKEQEIQEKDEIEDAQGECQNQLENLEEDKTNREDYNNKGAFTWKKKYTYILIGATAVLLVVTGIAINITQNRNSNDDNFLMKTDNIDNVQYDTQDSEQISKCMEEYVSELPMEDAYFAVKDINADGIDELLYCRNQEYVSYLTVLMYVNGNMETVLELEYQQYNGDLALCNGNVLTLIEHMADTQTVSYYEMIGESYKKTVVQEETGCNQNNGIYLSLNGEECSQEEFDYYNVVNNDWLGFNKYYTGNRYIQSTEKFVFHENTERGRKAVFDNQFCFSEYDKEVLKNLMGIIGYIQNEGIYTTGSELSPQEWSDQAKLEFMDYLMGSGLVDDNLVTSYVDVSCLNQAELDILQYDDSFTYYAMRVDDMNYVLENVIGMKVDTEMNTELVKYFDGYYIFKVGQFIDWIPYSEFEDEAIQAIGDTCYNIYAETGIGVAEYDESAEPAYELEGNDIRHFRNMYMEKNADSVCAGVQVVEWDAGNIIGLSENDFSTETLSLNKMYDLEDHYGICINDAISIIDDSAYVLDANSVRNILEHAEQMATLSGYNIMIVTTDNKDEKEIRQYAESYYNDCLNEFQNMYALDNDGYIFVFNPNTKDYAMSISGSTREYYTDEKIDGILNDDWMSQMKGENYESAFIQLIDSTIY